ncbi:hypothetical protein IL306_002374 [Fusarium sp. DS 682]|nr:hypothetical protein IL306_002374 [Fusarium sp. DS 682]
MNSFGLFKTIAKAVTSFLKPSPKHETEMGPDTLISRDEAKDFDAADPWDVVCFDKKTKRHMVLTDNVASKRSSSDSSS